MLDTLTDAEREFVHFLSTAVDFDLKTARDGYVAALADPKICKTLDGGVRTQIVTIIDVISRILDELAALESKRLALVKLRGISTERPN